MSKHHADETLEAAFPASDKRFALSERSSESKIIRLRKSAFIESKGIFLGGNGGT